VYLEESPAPEAPTEAARELRLPSWASDDALDRLDWSYESLDGLDGAREEAP